MSEKKSWRDAETIADLHAAGIKGFMFPDNWHKPEAEIVAAVKESMARIEEAFERGDFDLIADIGGADDAD